MKTKQAAAPTAKQQRRAEKLAAAKEEKKALKVLKQQGIPLPKLAAMAQEQGLLGKEDLLAAMGAGSRCVVFCVCCPNQPIHSAIIIPTTHPLLSINQNSTNSTTDGGGAEEDMPFFGGVRIVSSRCKSAWIRI
jgi:hypothetical protein